VNQDFLGTAAPRYADPVLLLEIGMGVALLVGAILARMRRFRAHAACQSAVVLLNLVIILLVMVPSFRERVSPSIPLKLGKPYYAVATAHAPLGIIVECAGLYILLATGTRLLPERIRITRYKL
jgi:Ca2+/H+ antiporter